MKIKSVSYLMSGLLCLAMISPVYASDDDTSRRLAELEQQMGAINQRLSTMEAQQPQSSSLLNLQTEIDTLKAEVTDLRGQLDVQAHDLETFQKRQTDLYQDMDARLRALQHSDGSSSAPGNGQEAASAPPPPPPPQDQAASDDNSAATHGYQAALNLFKQGNYLASIASFNKFIKTSPNSTLVPSAEYWIGNAYYSVGDYKNAVKTQQKLIKTFPGSAKVPDALLNISSAQVQLGNLSAARQTLQTLETRFPATPAAELAKKRLELLQ
ncbi:MAG TPA: tol-pal system protein YbgF [Burkholderiales bacterium]|nr:tol-pal system protein YbgF [Burkholderiales bacterium]